MKTLCKRVIKNTGNLDTINRLMRLRTKVRKAPYREPLNTAPKTGMTSLGVRRHASQWKGESKGVVVKLTRE